MKVLFVIPQQLRNKFQESINITSHLQISAFVNLSRKLKYSRARPKMPPTYSWVGVRHNYEFTSALTILFTKSNLNAPVCLNLFESCGKVHLAGSHNRDPGLQLPDDVQDGE